MDFDISQYDMDPSPPPTSEIIFCTFRLVVSAAKCRLHFVINVEFT